MKKPLAITIGVASIVLSLAFGYFWAAAPAAAEPVLPSGFITENVVTGLEQVTAVDWSQDGRMFIALKHGQVKVFENGQLLATDFIDISGIVNYRWDRGLVDIAVHPDFPNTPYVYLLFTYDPVDLPGAQNEVDGPDGTGARVSRLVRVSASVADSNVADPGSTVVVLGKNSVLANIGDPTDEYGFNGSISCESGGQPVEDCLPAESGAHSVATVTFGTDGSLFVGIGDGSDVGVVDPRALRAQDVDSLSGKVLRIHPETGEGYTNNPFYDGNVTHNRSRVWDYGFRNPFRFAIHPVSGQPFIGEVGWNEWEEINTGKGKNYGWPCYEGDNAGSARQSGYETDPETQAGCAAVYALGIDAVEKPLYSYPHPNPSENSGAIVGGDFYPELGGNYPARYEGVFFFADFVADWIKYMEVDAGGNASVFDFGTDVSGGTGNDYVGLVQLKLGPDNNLYFAVLDADPSNGGNDSEIRRIRYVGAGNVPPVAVIGTDVTNGASPLTVNFSGEDSYDPDGDPGDLSYEWDFGDGISSTLRNPVHVYTAAVPTEFRPVLTVTDLDKDTGTDSVLITVGNMAPSATIILPQPGTSYAISDTVAYKGEGTDAEDGSIGSANMTWEGILHFPHAVHPDFFTAVGKKGNFEYPDIGDENWLELCLTVTDSGGLKDTDCVDLEPNRVVYTLDTDPSGLQLGYGTVFATTPFTVETVVNAKRILVAPQPQGALDFVSWSDGSTEDNRTVTVGSIPETFVAQYRAQIYFPLMVRDSVIAQ